MLTHIRYWSQPLGRQAEMYAVVPQGPGPFPVVYQLHGLSDDASIWLRRTTIEPQFERAGIMVVTLDGGRGFYADHADGVEKWESHILASVDLVDQTFRTIPERAARGIGGLSMGGYGALRIGLRHPQRFASVVAHSGVACPRAWRALKRMPDAEMARIFGPTVADDAVPAWLAPRATPLPSLHIDCGSEDFLIQLNRDLHASLERDQIPHTYREYPGAHTWDYWDARLPEAIAHHRAAFGR